MSKSLFDNPLQPAKKIDDSIFSIGDKLIEELKIVRREKLDEIQTDENGDYVIRGLSMLKGGQPKDFKIYLRPVPHILIDSKIPLRGWYKDKHSPKNVRARPCYTDHLLTTPYGGRCFSRCSWCYVNYGTRGWRYTGVMTVNKSYPEQVRQNLSKLYIAFPFYISSFTDPFNPLEKYYHISEQVAQVAVDNNVPILFLSRQKMPEWAMDTLLKNPNSYAQWSVNVINEDDRRKLAPGCTSLDVLFRNIEEVNKRGIYTQFQVNPLCPGIIELEDVFQIIEKAHQIGVKHLLFKFIEILAQHNVDIVLNKFRQMLGDEKRVNKMESYLTQRIGGVITIDEKLRKHWLDKIKIKVESLGMTMGLCYEYERDSFHTAGKSMGPKYQTPGFGCHGKPIPVYYRDNLEDKFQPLKECYGMCLYCEEEGNFACKNETLLQAKALEFKDLRKIKLEL